MNDEEGLDAAYASDSNLHLDGRGTLFVAGTKGHLWDNEWLENFRDFGEPLVKKFGTTAMKVEQGDLKGAFNTLVNPAVFDVSQEGRYKDLNTFMRAHPDQVRALVGHSKGAAVVDQYMRENPDFAGRARLYSEPYDDLMGREKIKDWLNSVRQERDDYYKDRPWFQRAANAVQDKEQDLLEYLTGMDQVKGMAERGITRIANYGDFAAVLDSSADRYEHPNPLGHIMAGGPHDYHEGFAQTQAGFDYPVATVKEDVAGSQGVDRQPVSDERDIQQV